MTTIAHISDLHVLDLEGVTAKRFINKRLTGLANLWGPRRAAHSTEILERLVADLVEEPVDHVCVTGDLVNLSLEGEFARARGLLEPLATYDQLSVVPGNHDVYTHGAARARRFERYFGDLLWEDDRPATPGPYPWHKQVGGIHVVGLCSAVPRLPLLATGEVQGDQLDRLDALSAQHSFANSFAIAMVHHNLHPRSARKNLMHGLEQRTEVLDRCAAAGIDLLLHGHTHVAHRFEHGAMRVIGCGSSTWDSTDPGHVARYNRYHVTDGELTGIETRVYDRDTERFVPSSDVPAAA